MLLNAVDVVLVVLCLKLAMDLSSAYVCPRDPYSALNLLLGPSLTASVVTLATLAATWTGRRRFVGWWRSERERSCGIFG